MHDPSFPCFDCPGLNRLDALLIGPVKVERFPITREIIGIECLLHTAIIRITGGSWDDMYGETPSV